MSQPSVLIVSDEPDVAPTIMARWQTERSVPAFLLMTTPVWSESLVGACDMAIIAGVKRVIDPLLQCVDQSGKPAVCLVPDHVEVQKLRGDYPHLLLVREHEGWVDVLVALASESLRRLDAIARARRAEQALVQAEGQAMLGRYMLEMRHSLNNALTSVLGNSELLLLEPGAFSADVRDQLATIHTMAVRIHDILQRFSSLEMDIKFAKSQSEMDISHPSLISAR